MRRALKQTIAPVIVRIIMRYFAGALVVWGLVSPETGAALVGDPDLAALLLVGVGASLAALTEFAYGRARATGGPT